MNCSILYASCAVLLFLINPCAADALTLSEAQALAVKNSPQVNVLEAEISEARSRLNSTRLQSRPVVGIAGGGQLEGTATDRDLVPLAYAYAGMNLYNGRQTRIQESIAEIQVEKVQLEVPFKEFQLKKEIEGVFAEIALRDGMISIKREEMKLFEAHRRKAKDRKIAGLIGEADVLEFDLRKANLNNDVETLIAERDAYFRLLALLTGESKVARVEGYGLPLTMDIPVIPKAVTTDVSLSSKVLTKELSGLSLEKDLQAARWGPRIDLEGRAGFLPKEGDFEDDKARFDITLVAKFDLFAASQRNAASAENLGKKKRLEAMVQAENVNISILVDQSLTAMQNLRKKSQILKNNKMSAGRYYRSTLAEYERGIKNSPDVAHATEILFENEYKDMEIRYNLALQKIKLETVLMREI